MVVWLIDGAEERNAILKVNIPKNIPYAYRNFKSGEKGIIKRGGNPYMELYTFVPNDADKYEYKETVNVSRNMFKLLK